MTTVNRRRSVATGGQSFDPSMLGGIGDMNGIQTNGNLAVLIGQTHHHRIPADAHPRNLADGLRVEARERCIGPQTGIGAALHEAIQRLLTKSLPK